MPHSFSQLQCCSGCSRNPINIPFHRPTGLVSTKPQPALIRPCVLIVEFRDDFFVGIKTALEDYGYSVARAELGSAVAEAVQQFSPALVVVHESMPDESGWLTAAKLRIMRFRHPIWLYASGHAQLHASRADFCGVSQVIGYGGDLFSLVQSIRQLFVPQMNDLGSQR